MPDNITLGGREYVVRDLNDNDTFRVTDMVSRCMEDANLANAIAAQHREGMLVFGVQAVLRHATRDVRLFCADLIGLAGDLEERIDEKRREDDRRAQEEAKKLRDEARENGRQTTLSWRTLRRTPEEIRAEAEDEVLQEVGALPFGSVIRILNVVIRREDFDAFLDACFEFSEGANKLSGKWQNLFSKSSDSQT